MWTAISKDETQMADYWNVQHPRSSGKCNSKQFWHFITPVRLAKINSKWQLVLKRMWEKGNTYSFCKLVWTLWESVWQFLMKQKIDLSQNPAIPGLWILPKDSVFCYRDTCSSRYIATLFILSRNWRRPKRLSADERIRKMWYT